MDSIFTDYCCSTEKLKIKKIFFFFLNAVKYDTLAPGVRINCLKFTNLFLCILMDFPIHTDTFSMGLLTVYFKGSLVFFFKLWCIPVPGDF